MLKFFLNGQEVNSPRDWMDLEQELVRSYDDRTISTTYQNTVTFTGEAYELIAGVHRAQGYCAEVSFEVQESCNGMWQVACRGTIMLSDAEWNETRCEVEVSIVDNGIGARVDNNKGIPVSPTAVLSKNGAEITAVDPLALVMFDPYDGTDISGARRVFDWFDCVRHAIAYMTDGAVTMTSDWYEALPDDERYAIAYGNDLRVSGVAYNRFNYAWKDLFYELAKAYNLWVFAGETTAGQSFLRIEPESATFEDAGTLEILNVDNLMRMIDTDRLPASVVVGCDSEIRELQSDHSLPFVSMLGHSEEVFHFTGVCNTNEELDLTNKWITGNNAIEEVVLDGVDDFDKDIFIVQYDKGTGKATQGQYLNQGAAPYLYNEKLLNARILERYDLPSPVGSNNGPIVSDMQATATPAVVFPTFYHPVSSIINCNTEAILQFDDDYTLPNFDNGNVWGNGTTQGAPVSQANSRYKASAQGYYQFDTLIRWALFSSVPTYSPFSVPNCLYGRVGVRLLVKTFSVLDVQIGPTQTFTTPGQYLPGNYADQFTFGVSLGTGEYVVVYYQLCTLGSITSTQAEMPCFNFPAPEPDPGTIGTTWGLIEGCMIRTTLVVNGGYIVPMYTSRIERYEFDRSVPLQDWTAMVSNPEDNIRIDGSRYVHALNVKRNIATGEAEWKLIRRPT